MRFSKFSREFCFFSYKPTYHETSKVAKLGNYEGIHNY